MTDKLAASQRVEAPPKCSNDKPHVAHTFGGRPMQYCPGVEGCPWCWSTLKFDWQKANEHLCRNPYHKEERVEAPQRCPQCGSDKREIHLPTCERDGRGITHPCLHPWHGESVAPHGKCNREGCDGSLELVDSFTEAGKFLQCTKCSVPYSMLSRAGESVEATVRADAGATSQGNTSLVFDECRFNSDSAANLSAFAAATQPAPAPTKEIETWHWWSGFSELTPEQKAIVLRMVDDFRSGQAQPAPAPATFTEARAPAPLDQKSWERGISDADAAIESLKCPTSGCSMIGCYHHHGPEFSEAQAKIRAIKFLALEEK